MKFKSLFLMSILLGVATLSACTAFLDSFGGGQRTRQGQSSSLVDFLYPNREEVPPVNTEPPTLKLPLRVGLAFVPSVADRYGNSTLPAALKSELLEQVKNAFKGEKFLSEIIVIPDAYLQNTRGFEALDALGRLYTLDVVALVSYDQAASSADTKSSLLYWTIVGAYLVKGTKNEVQTFVDTAVFDIPTRKLLFRAPGIDHMNKSATMMESAAELRDAQQDSFRRAMTNMIGNLHAEMTAFEVRIKEDKSVKVAQRNPSSNDGGGGDFGLLGLAGLATLAGLRSRRRAPQSRS